MKAAFALRRGQPAEMRQGREGLAAQHRMERLRQDAVGRMCSARR